MDVFFNSFLLVFVSEMGDKTQLLALILAARFRKPVPILLGIFLATLINHAIASYVGVFVGKHLPEEALRWLLAATFIGCGVWMLIPDNVEKLPERSKWGPFLTTAVAFFFAEMGDKTQVATVALGARLNSPILVTVGTTAAMMAADGLAVFFGHRLGERVPIRMVHRLASGLFVIFGLAILLGK